MLSPVYTVTIVLLGKEEKKETGWFVFIMLYILHDEPNERILQNQKTILNITDLEPEEGEGDESSTKISTIFYIFIMVQYQKDSNELNTQNTDLWSYRSTSLVRVYKIPTAEKFLLSENKFILFLCSITALHTASWMFLSSHAISQ